MQIARIFEINRNSNSCNKKKFKTPKGDYSIVLFTHLTLRKGIENIHQLKLLP